MLSNLDNMAGSKKRRADLPIVGAPAFMVVGRIRRPHGVHGEVVAEFGTDFHDSSINTKEIYIGENHEKLLITSLRYHNEGFLLGFAGITTPELAGRYRNKLISIFISEAQVLPDGEYYFHELLDLNVVDNTGEVLGKLTEILKTGANDVYVVTDNSGKEILIPAIPEVVLKVDLVARTMKIHILPGLIRE
jgi:16S rRNA processing protein RimM